MNSPKLTLRLEWLGSILTILGTLFTTLPISWYRFGSVLYIIAGLCWIIVFLNKEMKGGLIMQLFLLPISLYGSIKFLINFM